MFFFFPPDSCRFKRKSCTFVNNVGICPTIAHPWSKSFNISWLRSTDGCDSLIACVSCLLLMLFSFPFPPLCAWLIYDKKKEQLGV